MLVKIQKNAPYIIYAESADTLGAAYGALVTSPQQVVNYREVMPFPEPLPITREMMMNMMASMHMHEHKNHSQYRIAPGASLFAEYEHEDTYGAFRNILHSEGDQTVENTITFGISLLF